MEIFALFDCIITPACLISQTAGGLKIGMLLFLVASGLTLVFGVLGVINFAHGALYMLGAYFSWQVMSITSHFGLAVISGAIGVGIFGLLFERLLINKVYNADLLVQILLCYSVILILDDLVMIIWGDEFLSGIGVPEIFQVPPIFIFDAIIPPFHIAIILISMIVAFLLWIIMTKTKFGKLVRATAINPKMLEALGVNTNVIKAGVFMLGSFLAGLGGALAASLGSVVSGMGNSIIIESFIVTVIGGMGSISGAFLASIIIGMARSFGAVAMPLFTDGIMFLIMVLVLVIKPEGLMGKKK
ncbi:MAG: branched-chain amino acid ABC transporter permease [Pelagibacterales bacterium]|nr:branched-chain amino acid ABC transporter permease [Pelagibacterales bacterium]PPR15959.1 MAG: High-affinity branched-chain amino acid transport system permease protein LivH [Alphaproteobacteria bacterium MarineAlpha9_Bin3]|tara:strand:- start:2453 stop:3355 length:903 start_codon:yes stop_codon:yes gene_type:complete